MKTFKKQLQMETLESRRMFAAGGTLKLPYTYAVTGNAADVGSYPASLQSASSGLALMGGGTDVDEVFRWMGAKAMHGDFLVIRATGTDAYDSYIKALVPSLDSVATLIIPDLKAANNTEVARIISGAEAIFIAGGDQSNYVDFWNNTPVESAIYQALIHHIPIGGTSAGLAVLGDVDFTAGAGTITSSKALSNPLDKRITDGLNTNFLTPDASELQAGSPTILHYLDHVITDSHFMQEDRMGRLMTFMAYSDANNLVPSLPRGIGINEQTALLIEPDGVAHVVGNAFSDDPTLTNSQQQRSVYLLQGVSPNPVLKKNTALNYNVHVAKAEYNPLSSSGDAFDLDDLFGSTDWKLPSLTNYDITAVNGRLVSSYAFNSDAVDSIYSSYNSSDSIAKRRSRLI